MSGWWNQGDQGGYKGGGKGGQGGRGKGKGGWNGGPFASKSEHYGGKGLPKGPRQDLRALTGPYLGKGSELKKVWWMPDNQGHESGIFAATVMGERVCTAGQDGRLLVWAGSTSRHGTLALAQDNQVEFPAAVTSVLFHAESKWLFCGMINGLIRAFRQDPPAESTMQGHNGAVTSMLVHQAILLSGSHDGTVRAWQFDAASAAFHCVATIQSPLGKVFRLLLPNAESLWVGAEQGISCVSLQTMQAVGSIASPFRVVGLLAYQGSVIAAFANGALKVFDTAGNVQFNQEPLGEHGTNTSIAIMRIPYANKDVLLCGQELGYVTVYDIPDFKPRGSFTTGWDGEVMAIVDMMADGIFVTCGMEGDIVIWQWVGDAAGGMSDGMGGMGMGGGMISNSPF